MTDEPARTNAESAARLAAFLDSIHERAQFTSLIGDWPSVRDEIVAAVLENSSADAGLADMESRASTRLFDRESGLYREMLELATEESPPMAEDEGRHGEHGMPGIRPFLKSLTERFFLSIDYVIVWTTPGTYRRQLQVDTARKVIDLCASEKRDDKLKCARLAGRVWRAAEELKALDRQALVDFADRGRVPSPGRTPQQFFALVSAAHEVGKRLDGEFDAVVRQDDVDGSSMSEAQRIRHVVGDRTKR